MKIEHAKNEQAHFRVHFREHCRICREHSRGSLRGHHLVGISVDIFKYAPVCSSVSTLVRDFVGQSSRFACSLWLSE